MKRLTAGVVRRVWRSVSDCDIEDGAGIPWWLGRAWYELDARRCRYMLIPCNWLAGWWRTLWRTVQRGPADPVMEAHWRGFNNGFAEGQIGRAHV